MSELLRRARLYGSRTLRTLPGAGLKHRCFFMHLPKCGGTSLAAALYGTVPLNRRIGVIDALATRRTAAIRHFGRNDLNTCHEDLPNGTHTFALREEMLLMHMSWNTQLIHGHVLFSTDAQVHFSKFYKTVTLMRDPYLRTLSNYKMAVHTGVIPDDIDAWLAGPVGLSMSRVYLRYLGGKNVILPEDLDRQMAQAHANLDVIDLVGFLDDLPDFALRFAEFFGAHPRVPHYNPARGNPIRLTLAQHRQLTALLEPDNKLYETALENTCLGRNNTTSDGSSVQTVKQRV